jgi:type IV pilus assembly protein PilQ
VKRHLGFGTLGSLVAGSALVVLAAQPARAAATVITGVAVNSTDGGMQLMFQTQAGTEPQIFTISQNNTLRADIIHARLNLPDGESFSQSNPAPGIDSITVSPLDANSVRVTVNGTNAAPASQGESFTGNRLSLDFSTSGQTAQAPTPVPNEIQTVPGNQSVPQVAQDPGPTQTQQNPDVMVPNPEVTIDGTVVPRPQQRQAPPFMPRAVAPPVGDIAVSEVNSNPDSVDLGTAERVPRLVLRDAPVRDVLSLLARAAGLNLAFTDVDDSGAPRSTDDALVVSLDIENEPLQDVFNYVLRISGLEFNRVGRTIFVGPRLPDTARNIVARTFRLNQATSEAVAGFLTTQGAVTQLSINEITVEIIGGGETGLPPRLIERETPVIRALEAESGRGPLLLSGLSISTDERLNTITLVGTPRQVEIASNLITQLDLRRRQVAINVKVVDVNLLDNSSFGASFSFGVGDTNVLGTAGAGVVNFGNNAPVSTPGNTLGSLGAPAGRPIGAGGPLATLLPFNFVQSLLLQLQASISSGTAKILTDPTLVVQEGQLASVALTEDVLVGVASQVSAETGAVSALTPQFDEAGLTLQISGVRVDDNGFVSMEVELGVNAVGEARGFVTPTGNTQQIFTLRRREVSSGLVRLRDAQTLVLSGIIQESERTSARRIPILGDLPILGSLFRSTTTQRERAEVIVLLTPQILDDSDQAVWGYGYTPSEDVQELLERSQQR